MKNSRRTIPLPEAVAHALARHIADHPTDDPDRLLFTAHVGGRLRVDVWNRTIWKPAAAAVGRPRFTFHVLRHFYASALIRENRAPVVMARRMGNSPEMVQRTCAHL